MAIARGMLVDGPLAGGRVYVHLFARGEPIRRILVFERPLRGMGEWLRWRLWNQPPEIASYDYRVLDEDAAPRTSREQRAVRYRFDPKPETRCELDRSGKAQPRSLTEIVFARLP